MYTYILTKKSDGLYLGWSTQKDEPFNGDPDNLVWVPWNKALPEDIDENTGYRLIDGQLVR